MADDFFQEHTAMAQSAMRNLVKNTRQRLEHDVDVRPLIRERPWTSLLAAFGGGMVTGFLVMPRRPKDQENQEHGNHRHRTAIELLQRQLLAVLPPTLRAFATTAAATLFHDLHTHGEHHEQAQEQYKDLPHHRIQI